MGFSTSVVFLTFLVTVLAVSNLLEMVGGEADGAQNELQCRWQPEKLSQFCSALVKAIPLAAIRIIVVALQIIIQVRGIRNSLMPLKSVAPASRNDFQRCWRGY